MDPHQPAEILAEAQALAVESVQATLRTLSSLMKDREVGPHGAEPLSIAELWAANTTSLHVLFTLTFFGLLPSCRVGVG